MGKWVRRAVGGACVALLWGVPMTVQAATVSERATVTANVIPRTELALIRDENSVTRFSAQEVVFDRYDDQDGQPDGNPLFMYAPYRSEPGKNWHVASMLANGSTMTLSADVSGNAGGQPLATILDVFYGGFFGSDGSNSGGASGDWELLDAFTRTLNQPFIGVGPLNYRLRLQGVPASTTPYTGQITYTLTSN